MELRHDLRAVAHEFQIAGDFVAAEPYGSGHINDTYAVTFRQGGAAIRYLFQRINHFVFKNPVALMENIHRVTSHLGKKLEGQPDAARRTLTLIPTRDNNFWYRDPAENFWRAYIFIENARTYDAVESSAQAYQAAKAFGQFQKLLADFPAPRLHDTIPDFHHTPKRLTALKQAVAADSVGRVKLAGPEIEFCLQREPMTRVLLEANLPERVTHNDTKFNNVMLDDATGQGTCVIDLDTVMPGLALYDFGDMVRTTTSPANEDERDLAKVRMQMPMFEALVRGYLSSADFLTAEEKKQLVLAGKLITLEIGNRPLTDFLAGDVYFKVKREGHNLDRCRTQFAQVMSMEQQQAAMEACVRDAVTG